MRRKSCVKIFGESIVAADVTIKLKKMQSAIHLGKLDEFQKNKKKFQRVYFGNEFCEKLIPDVQEIKRFIKFFRDKKLDFTFVTPYCTDEGISKLKIILPLLPKKTEVVFNDWGVLELLKENSLSPLLGRLLVSIKRDVRIDPKDRKYSGYFQTSNLKNPSFQEFLLKNNIFRVELDNVLQGYNFKLKPEIKTTLHYPFVYVSTARKCVAARFLSDNSRNFFSYSECGLECTRSEFYAKIDGGLKQLILRGNSIFYKNNSIKKNLVKWNTNRLVFCSQLPFAAGHKELWDNYYKHHPSDAAWGVAKADEHVMDFLKYNSFFMPRAKILDSGCGHGKNAELFLAKGLKTYGIDISTRAIIYCKKRNPQGIFRVQNASEINLKSYFDAIVDAGCMHSAEPNDHQKIINNYQKSLKKGGCLFIRIFRDDRKSVQKKPLFFVGSLPVYGYSKSEILNIFKKNKFTVEKIILNKEQGRGISGVFYVYLKK